MGDQSQIRLIEPKPRTITYAAKSKCRTIPDEQQIERAFERFCSGAVSVFELSRSMGCSEATLSNCFRAEFGDDWRKQKGTWL